MFQGRISEVELRIIKRELNCTRQTKKQESELRTLSAKIEENISPIFLCESSGLRNWPLILQRLPQMGGMVVRTVKRRGAEERRGCESIHATHASFSSELVVGVDRWQPTLVGPVTLLL